MKKIFKWHLFLIVFILSSLVFPLQVASAEPYPMINVLVSFERQPGGNEAELIKSHGGQVKKSYHLLPTVLAHIPENKMKSLKESRGVSRVEPDVAVRALGQVLPWGVDRVDAEKVHPSNKGTGVKVALLDTGIDLAHPDLIVAGQVTFVAGTPSADDDNGHGTLVAGIVAARNNGIGIIGVAPEVQLYAVKVLDSYGSGLVSDIISGIQWAVDNGMQVVNMSFGGSEWPWAGEQALANAHNAGIVLVASAGNRGTVNGSGDNIGYPARYDTVIAVGATDEQNVRLSNSSTGYALEVMAPGSNIFSTARGGEYRGLGFTSAASPHVAGVAALLIKAGIASNTAIRKRLQDSALDLGIPGWDTRYGKGLVNAYQAINFTGPRDKAAPNTTIVLTGTPGKEGWYKSDVTVTLQAVDNPGGSGLAQTIYSLDDGNTWNLYQSPLLFNTEGQRQILARSRDVAGNDEGPPKKAYFRVDKTPPTVTVTVSPRTLPKSNSGTIVYVYYVYIDGTAADIPLTSGLASSNLRVIDEYSVYNLDYGAVRLGVNIPLEAWGRPDDNNGRTYTIIATATDVAGNSSTATTTVTVSPI